MKHASLESDSPTGPAIAPPMSHAVGPMSAPAAMGNHAFGRWLAMHRDRKLEDQANATSATADLSATSTPGRESPPDAVWHALQRPAGMPLAPRTRGILESRFHSRLDGVRVHQGSRAEAAADSLGASAFALGRDIYFGPGQYRPGTRAGDHLLAHEVAHTIQQSKGSPGVQMQDKSAAPPDITASDIIGIPQGARVALVHQLGGLMTIIRNFMPAAAAALDNLKDVTATVATSTADQVEIRIDQPINVPAMQGQAARTISKTRITLTRNKGLFDFAVMGTEGQGGQETESTLYQETGLTAQRDGDAFTLAAGTERHFRIAPGTKDQAVSLAVYTKPFLGSVSPIVRSMAPDRLDVLKLVPIPDVRPGTEEEKKVVEKAVQSYAVAPPPRQTLTAGVGVGLHRPDLLLSVAWRYSFRPPTLKGIGEVPLQVELLHSPTQEFIGSVTSGIGASLGFLKIPINVRIYGGLGGGSALGDPDKTGVRPVQPIFGPEVGLAVGYERGWFRAEARVQDLINVLGGSSVPGAFAGVGGAF